MRCTIRQLEIFIAVVEEEGFSAAGERLHMVQPAVSIAIRKLEESAGLKLLNRTSVGVLPTDEGRMLLAHARSICSQVDTLSQNLNDMRSLTMGHVTIGAPPIVSAFLLPGLITRFIEQHPGVRFTVMEGGVEEIAARVRSGELDAGFIPGTQVSAELETVFLKDHPVSCAVAADSPLAQRSSIDWATLLDQQLILFPRGYNQRNLVDAAVGRLGKAPRIIVEAESWTLQIKLVQAGCGVSLFFTEIIAMHDGVVAIPLEDRASIPVSICRNSNGGRSIAANSFFESVLAEQRLTGR